MSGKNDPTTFQIINTFIITIIFIIIILIGIFFLFDDTVYTGSTIANINSSRCTSTIDKNNNSYYRCTMELEYKIKNATIKKNIIVDSYTLFLQGQPVEVQYNPKNYNDIQIKQYSYTEVGIIYLFTGLFVIYGVWLIIS